VRRFAIALLLTVECSVVWQDFCHVTTPGAREMVSEARLTECPDGSAYLERRTGPLGDSDGWHRYWWLRRPQPSLPSESQSLEDSSSYGP